MKITKQFIQGTKGNIAAAIHYPSEQTEKLAILCPGFLDSKDYAGLTELANRLAERGCTVARFDPTGVWESEGDIANYTTTQYLEDIKNVLEHMLAQDSYKHILLGGHSRGGMLSLLYAARDERITTVLGIMPSSSRSMTPERENKWKTEGVSVSTRDLPDNREERIEFRVPYSHVTDRAQYNVIADAQKIAAKVVLIAGENDKLIPPEDVKVIFDNAKEPKSFIVVPKVEHDYRLHDDDVKVVNEYILKELGI